CDFVGAQWRAVNRVAAGLGWRAMTDARATTNQGRARLSSRLGFGPENGCVNRRRVVSIDIGNHIPVVCGKTGSGVVTEPARYIAINGNAVVIIEADQFAQSERAGQRASFMADTFHQATVADKDIGVMVHNCMAGAVVAAGQQFFGKRHAHGIGQTLPQRASRGLYAGSQTYFGVAGRARMQLAVLSHFIEWQVVTD